MNPAVAATEDVFRLAEGPVWDVERSRLLWVDIPAGLFYEGTLKPGADHGPAVQTIRRHEVGGMIGAVTPAVGNGRLVAAQEHLIALGPDGSRIDGPRIVPHGRRWRCNDGGTDPSGRFVIGTLALGGPPRNQLLVRLEPDGQMTVLDDDLHLSNGLAWSTDGRTMYSVDSLQRTIFARAYDPLGQHVGTRQVHLRLEDGLPDGITVDAADHLWVAVWGAGEVRRYAPDGGLVARVSVPAPHTTSVALAGDDLCTLVISTASDELSTGQLKVWPDAGRLFITQVDVPGLPTVPWSGAVFRPDATTTGPAFADFRR